MYYLLALSEIVPLVFNAILMVLIGILMKISTIMIKIYRFEIFHVGFGGHQCFVFWA